MTRALSKLTEYDDLTVAAEGLEIDSLGTEAPLEAELINLRHQPRAHEAARCVASG